MQPSRIFSAARRVVPVVLFAALTAYLVSYSAGKISVPENNYNPPVGAQQSEQQTAPAPDENIPQNMPDIKPAAPDIGGVLAQLAQNSAKAAQGYVITDLVFDSESFILASATPAQPEILPDAATYTVNYESGDGTPVAYTYYTLRPRMGYISLANETSSAILDQNGKVIPVPAEFHLSFAACRDKNGKPVFVDYITGLYYTITDGIVEKSDYDPEADFRGLVFDYPSYYGVSDDPESAVVSSARGYGYTVKGSRVSPIYSRAYPFSEGFGCAHDARGRLYFFNNRSKLAFGGLEDNLFGCGADNGENSLGYYYFDEGLTRVTVRTVEGGITKDRTDIVCKYGKELAIPSDFNIKAYSCGRILLEKNGCYGYMDSHGRWVSDPVYNFARPFFEGLAVVLDANGKKGVIDKNGSYVIPPVFDEITDCSGGIICAYDKELGWHIIHKLMMPAPEPVPEQQTPAENENASEESVPAEPAPAEPAPAEPAPVEPAPAEPVPAEPAPAEPAPAE